MLRKDTPQRVRISKDIYFVKIKCLQNNNNKTHIKSKVNY